MIAKSNNKHNSKLSKQGEKNGNKRKIDGDLSARNDAF
jgi:hypothetical protein